MARVKKKSKPSFKLSRKSKTACAKESKSLVHEYGNKHICTTDGIGYATPGNKSPLEIVVDSSEGFIPLWDEDVVIRWEFDEQSLAFFTNTDEIKNYVRGLMGEALLKWGDAAPIRFSENSKAWDFKLRIQSEDNCNPRGCTLARAFFPDPGRNDLLLFPKMFEQSRKEQVDTVIHELGHIFGLRHFFAKISENQWPSEIFGEHKPFSIMNYGELSELTEDDKDDLALLYDLVWSGELTEINGTPIRLFKPYHDAEILLAR